MADSTDTTVRRAFPIRSRGTRWGITHESTGGTHRGVVRGLLGDSSLRSPCWRRVVGSEAGRDGHNPELGTVQSVLETELLAATGRVLNSIPSKSVHIRGNDRAKGDELEIDTNQPVCFIESGPGTNEGRHPNDPAAGRL
jgi:hypothetical protein